MRRIVSIAAALGLILGAFELGRHSQLKASQKPAKRILYYVDPMHPAYRADHPGVAPDCGMQLKPVYEDSADSEVARSENRKSSPGSVFLSHKTQQLVGLQVTAADSSTQTEGVSAVGRVAPEDTLIYRINAGVDGFVRETFQDAEGTLVQKNQRLATYYAPEYLSAISGFLAANERVPGAVTAEGGRSLQNFQDRLQNLGMSEPQIKQIATTKQYPESIDVMAPANGVILLRNVSAGEHFAREAELYRLADLSKVWIMAEVQEEERPYLRPGARAQIIARAGGEAITAHLTDALPESDPNGKTVRIRLEADNPHLSLRPNMVVDVRLHETRMAAVTVPSDAVVETGEHARVYVARDDQAFEPREVETGWRNADRVQIVRGLSAGERVVTNATFLIDSESRLRSVSNTVAQ